MGGVKSRQEGVQIPAKLGGGVKGGDRGAVALVTAGPNHSLA